MKNLNYAFLLLVFLAGLVSCSDDDASTPCTEIPPLSENIIGKWLIDGSDEVEFRTDGRFIDSDNPIIETSLQGQDLVFKTWSVDSDVLSIKASNEEGGTLSATDDFTALSQDCDAIDFEYQGFITYSFTRN